LGVYTRLSLAVIHWLCGVCRESLGNVDVIIAVLGMHICLI